MSTTTESNLLLIADRDHQAYLAFARFPDDPLVITPWHHHAGRGQVLRSWTCEDWRGVMRALNALPRNERTGLLRQLLPPLSAPAEEKPA